MTPALLSSSGGWRKPILRHFTPHIAAAARLTIVADPDRLLAEQTLLEEIRERGFDLVTFEDPIAFRYAYESGYRRHWDEGTQAALVVLLRVERDDVESLPFDLLELARQNHRVLRFSLAEIFPQLSPRVVAELDRRHFGALHEAVQTETPPTLGERGSRDFILRHVFEFAPELVRDAVDLLRFLLRRHYSGDSLPAALDHRLIERLHEAKRFSSWPLDQIVHDRQAFFSFLDERWPIFVRAEVERTDGHIAETKASYGLAFSGPAEIPFSHQDIRVYIDNLFIEGLLTPTTAVSRSAVAGTWLQWGVVGEPENDAIDRFQKLGGVLAKEIPDDDAPYGEWLEFAQRWFEWSSLRAEVDLAASIADEVEQLWASVDLQFTNWMLGHFGSLHNIAYLPHPVMVHHVIQHMAHASGLGERVAMVVVDGMSGGQWAPLRASLARLDLNLGIRERAVFGWVPTITPVSRQAIFSGEIPLYFRKSISTTSKDEQHWRRFWDGRGLSGPAVQFVAPRANELDDSFLERLRTAAGYPSCKALGVVIPKIDQMVHGAATGARGLHSQIRHWANDGHFGFAIRGLVEQGFTVYITSDHGNTECRGFGKPNVGAVAGERGERVHVFEDELLREKSHTEFRNTVLWPNASLPEDYLPLLATGRGAFITPGAQAVSHGGISLEEVIVPFAIIEGSA